MVQRMTRTNLPPTTKKKKGDWRIGKGINPNYYIGSHKGGREGKGDRVEHKGTRFR